MKWHCFWMRIYGYRKNHRREKRFLPIFRKICGKEPAYSYFQGIGDFNYLGTRLGAPAIVFGPSGENCHAQDEYVELDSVHQTAWILYDFLEETKKVLFA